MVANTNRIPGALWLVTLIAYTSLAGACAQGEDTLQLDEASDPIINGTQSTDGQFSSVGALLWRESCGFLGTKTCYRFHCSGMLITPTVVLTAAHCVSGQPPNRFYFTLNHDAGSTTSSTRSPVISLALHPSWGGLGIYDLALATLEWSPGSATAQLVTPAEDASLGAGTSTAIVGYGLTGPFATGGAGVKHHGAATVTGSTPTTLTLSNYTQGAASCRGDSGGPAYISRGGAEPRVAIGVVSGGDQFCTQGASYTRVGADLMWFHRNVALPCDSGLPCTQRCGDGRCDHGFESYPSCPDCPPPCRTTCDSWECGYVSNGCGGYLYCGSCNCQWGICSGGPTTCCESTDDCPSGRTCLLY